MMQTKKLLIVLPTFVLLTACASRTQPSLTPSLAQTGTLVPTVNCSQDVADEVLPTPYPTAPTIISVETLQSHITDLNVWAVQAAGAFRREKVKRNTTTHCLDDLRSKGLIN